MSARTELPADEPTIVMTRIYAAPREMVWHAITQPRHVRQWWGGPGVTNPVCEMDVRPRGLWNQIMRFPDGRELHMHFVFLEVEKPRRLVWRHSEDGKPSNGPPVSIAVTLEDLGARTRWTMVARFASLAEREAALAMGFADPIEASNDRFADYLKTMEHPR